MNAKATLAALTLLMMTLFAFGAYAQDGETAQSAGEVVINGESYKPDPNASKTLSCMRYDRVQKKWVKCRVCRNGLCLIKIKKTRAGSDFKVTE